jgi:hypothetical protein
MKKNQVVYISLFFLLLFNLTSCAPSGDTSEEYGFFSGLWHGFVFVFSLIGKLFSMDIGIYAEHNTGFTYWIGFLIGLGGFGGGSYSARY